MSSDIDDDGDYSSIDEKDPKMDLAANNLVTNKSLILSEEDDEDESSAERQGPPLPPPPQTAQNGHPYVNMTDSRPPAPPPATSMASTLASAADSDQKEKSKRERNRYSHGHVGNSRSSRKSRSRERPSGLTSGSPGSNNLTGGGANGGANLNSPVNPSSLSFCGPIDQDRIRERERELEKIHRRSRELMLSPRLVEARGNSGSGGRGGSREGSLDRLSLKQQQQQQQQQQQHYANSSLLLTAPSPTSTSGVTLDGWKPGSAGPLPPPPATAPPPLPPRIQSPNATSGGNNHRYKSSSPVIQPPFPPSSTNLHHHHHHPPPSHVHHNSHSRLANSNHNHNNSSNTTSLRRRVQSPNRRDFKDFSQHPRDFRSPMRMPPQPPRSSYLDEDDDSGADSLGNDHTSSNSCHSHHGSGCGSCGPANNIPSHHSHRSNHGSSMALVPYDTGGGGGCCGSSRGHHHHDCCGCSSTWRSGGGGGHSMALQTLPGVEERLLQLEGDKDSLHLQVALLSDQLESQTDKISDLEKILDDKKDVLRKTEDVLQREMLTRSSLETKKLELMTEISSLKLHQANIEQENMELRKKLGAVLHRADGPRSAPVQSQVETIVTLPPSGSQKYPLLSPPASASTTNTLQTFGTMPRRSRHAKHHQQSRGATASPTEAQLGTDEDWLAGKLSNAHSGSAPSLALEDQPRRRTPVSRSTRHQSVERSLVTQYSSQVPMSSGSQQQQPIATKPKGLKKILGRMRRSNSGTIHEDRKKDSDNETLRRGGLRASAGSRFAGWMGPSNTTTYPDPNLPFRQWKVETICSWLDNLGLYMYSSEVRKHIKLGEQLLAMSSHDLEVKLGMKSILHRKKVLLALQAKQEPVSDLPGRLDHQWVVRWLDDVGLPQYKDAFLEARIDGRVLNFITVEDLFQLKVTNLLHHLSIRRGIQVLRSNNFEPQCLKRRASPDEKDRNSLPIEVALWSNHRVMEWLRHVDLSEYAPNLRGSGVHGGLLIYEPRFNADLLASLLSIPANKTLLRRHLTLHFRDLVGPEVIQEKRSAEEEPHFQALTPTAKVKPLKRSQFSLRRRKYKGSDDLEFDDLVCPIEDAEEEKGGKKV